MTLCSIRISLWHFFCSVFGFSVPLACISGSFHFKSAAAGANLTVFWVSRFPRPVLHSTFLDLTVCSIWAVLSHNTIGGVKAMQNPYHLGRPFDFRRLSHAAGLPFVPTFWG